MLQLSKKTRDALEVAYISSWAMFGFAATIMGFSMMFTIFTPIEVKLTVIFWVLLIVLAITNTYSLIIMSIVRYKKGLLSKKMYYWLLSALIVTGIPPFNPIPFNIAADVALVFSIIDKKKQNQAKVEEEFEKKDQ
ncbi:hypothetical protein [Mesoplasma seiffertii]|uniref:hypothetical protein n=1 Tax=Mesoplasma seiffertii TaxID=28224 RepID=UPI0012EBD7EF|nr:hypothetical protein [Mesoplasma seiffertii]